MTKRRNSKIAFMEGAEYREIVDKVGMNLRSMGKFLRVGERSTYRYGGDDSTISGPVADLMLLLRDGKITMDDIKIARAKQQRRNGM